MILNKDKYPIKIPAPYNNRSPLNLKKQNNPVKEKAKEIHIFLTPVSLYFHILKISIYNYFVAVEFKLPLCTYYSLQFILYIFWHDFLIFNYNIL